MERTRPPADNAVRLIANRLSGNGEVDEHKAMLAANYIAARAAVSSALGKQFGGKRDMYKELGYSRNLRYEDFFRRYQRGDVAKQIIDAPASATWRNVPEVLEEQDETDGESETEFEKAWNQLVKDQRVMHYLERVDRLAGIGRYALLLLGVRDGQPLSEELAPGTLDHPGDLLYLSPYSEGAIDKVVSWETDPTNARFGKPKVYKVDLTGDMGRKADFDEKHQEIHHTRVLHVAEDLLEDEVFGTPRLQHVYNRLQDLDKTVGGGAEMFWQGAFRGIQFDMPADVEVGTDDKEDMRQEIEKFVHGLQRYLRTKGVDAKVLQGEVANPKGIFEVLMSLIAGATRIPKRVLLGSERGELASTQDIANWVSHVSERQEKYAEPQMLRPLIDMLIQVGILPEPAEGYKVEWPNLFEMDDAQEAEIASSMATAIKNYAPFGDTESVVPVGEFREKFLGLEPEPEEGFPERPDMDLDEGEPDEEFMDRYGDEEGGEI